MDVEDEVLILDTASAVDYEDGPGWDIEMDSIVGKRGYIVMIGGDTAYVTRPGLPFPEKDDPGLDGFWWKLKDLQVIPSSKWRRGACE